MGRVAEYEQIVGNQAYRGSYEYNLAGQLTAEIYPSGRRQEYRLDSDGDLAEVVGRTPGISTGKSYLSNLERNSSGLVENARLGNGRWQSTAYNSRNQIEEINLGFSDGDSGLLDLSLEYGSLNNGALVEQRIDFNGLDSEITQNYEYDSLNRLISVGEATGRGISWTESYQYDRYGNRMIDTRGTTTLADFNKVTNPLVESATNRLATMQDSDSAPDFVYDAAGNLTRDAEGKRYQFDAENRVTAYFRSSNHSGEPDTVYQYDGSGRRVRKVTPSGETVFVYNAYGKLVAEYADSTPGSPSIRYVTKDHLGSSRVITDGAGVVLTRDDYLAFGESLSAKLGPVSGRSETHGYGGDNKIRQQYTGYERDEESSLDFAQARYYNSQQGRFTSVDPLTASASLKNPQTFNRYSYVLNNPYKFVDPLGLISQGTGACGQYCSNVIGGGFNGGTVFDQMSAHEWLGYRGSKRKPEPVPTQGESATPPIAEPLEPPQHLVSAATERLTDVTVSGGGIAETEGILVITPELNELWISGLNTAFDRGVRVGAAAKASNGEAVISSMTQGVTMGGSVTFSGNASGPGGSVSGSGTKSISTTRQSLGTKAVNMDIDARAANTVTALGAAGKLQNEIFDVATAGGTIQAQASYGFFNKVFTDELNKMYMSGMKMGYDGTVGRTLTYSTSVGPKQ
jgi:RHS repeat-associated protein